MGLQAVRRPHRYIALPHRLQQTARLQRPTLVQRQTDQHIPTPDTADDHLTAPDRHRQRSEQPDRQPRRGRLAPSHRSSLQAARGRRSIQLGPLSTTPTPTLTLALFDRHANPRSRVGLVPSTAKCAPQRGGIGASCQRSSSSTGDGVGRRPRRRSSSAASHDLAAEESVEAVSGHPVPATHATADGLTAPVARVDRVVARTAGEAVRARVAPEGVVPRVAGERVVARAGGEGVVAGAAGQAVSTAEAGQDVVATEAANRSPKCEAGEPVRGRRCRSGCWRTPRRTRVSPARSSPSGCRRRWRRSPCR